ncbi:MAG: alpha/beta hydrolase [Candidatus Nanopelagicales bacterium]|nr:alpha/beta hydrolase [Candidatus Nanopelagicales bacterium]
MHRSIPVLLWLRAAAISALLAAAAVLGTAPASALPASDVQLRPTLTHAAGTTFAWASIGSGPPLVLLNGTASPMSEWDPALLGALAVQRRVIVFDYPGLGQSGPAPDSCTFDHAADWINDWLRVIEPAGPVDVLGWSMGGFIAQRLAVQHPERIRRLVLAATNPGGDATVLGPRWVQDADSSGSLAGYLSTNYPPSGRAAGERFLTRLENAVNSGRYPDVEVPARTRRAMVRAEDPWLRSDSNLAKLGTVTLPTLVITGLADVITPAANSRVLARAIPGARLVLTAGAGHSFLFQRPRRVAAEISRFLSGQSTASTH